MSLPWRDRPKRYVTDALLALSYQFKKDRDTGLDFSVAACGLDKQLLAIRYNLRGHLDWAVPDSEKLTDILRISIEQLSYSKIHQSDLSYVALTTLPVHSTSFFFALTASVLITL